MLTVCDIYWLNYLYKCRAIFQDGDSFEGKLIRIMNNTGTLSYCYMQGVNKYSDGVLIEGSSINQLWNGKLNLNLKKGNRSIFEMLNDKGHGPSIVYYFDGKVKMSYYSNGKKIFLL